MYTLKSIVKRGSMLGVAVAVFAATALPATSAFADALNPLTHRSLTLSSSAPGWDSTDGSGNATYAQPNSGANGKQTGNTFSFNVSTDSSASNTIKGFTFQYCTVSAGACIAPGNDSASTTPGSDDASHADLNVVSATPTETTSTGLFDLTNGVPTTIPNRNNTQGNYVVLQKDAGAGAWTLNSGWTMTASNKEESAGTGKNNFITLKNASGGLSLHHDGQVKIIFFGTDTNYITNPGAGAFFVKINDYNLGGAGDTLTAASPALVDGGVTVANVMNQSIEIQTKVLETMDFSVGTVDPYTLDSTGGASSPLYSASGLTSHGSCDRILSGMVPGQNVNTLQLGDTASENSLATNHTYSTHSYWRLSSNSSAGATVYYSGVTLSNTVGDQIHAIGPTATDPHLGTEQFGLALANGTNAANPQPLSSNPGSIHTVDYGVERVAGHLYENAADNSTNGVHATVATDTASLGSYHSPRLYPLIPASNYDSGAGVVNADYNGGAATVNTKFAFDTASNLIPTPIATENAQVVDCVTGKMRYIANIAATTPAGIYTTKVNYIAAPQY